jgi:hypothetical protein
MPRSGDNKSLIYLSFLLLEGVSVIIWQLKIREFVAKPLHFSKKL